MSLDLIVIGGGPGGYTAAIRAAQLGAQVALVEAEKLGGTCLNKGCIPTKALYKSAQAADSMKNISEYGVMVDRFSLDFHRMQERKREIVAQLGAGVEKLIKANRIELIYGHAELVNAGLVRVRVKEGDGKLKEIRGRNILLATGSRSAMPPIPGLDLPGVLDSEQILACEEIPPTLLIIGGGVVGIEFAGIFQALGTQVTVVESSPVILAGLDSEIRRRLLMQLKKKGIQIITDVLVKEIAVDSSGLQVLAQAKSGRQAFTAQKVLVSTGRKPNLAGLGLEQAGVNYDAKGVKVDARYATNVPGIYAIGDVTGKKPLAHVAAEEGIAAVENIMGRSGHVNYEAIPDCIFSFPEVASVGLTEEQAKEKGIPYTISRSMFAANGKALTMGEAEGMVKVISSNETKEIIGVHILGPHASDLIHEASLGLAHKMNAESIGRTVHAHPTLAECFLEAVNGLENKAIHLLPGK